MTRAPCVVALQVATSHAINQKTVIVLQMVIAPKTAIVAQMHLATITALA